MLWVLIFSLVAVVSGEGLVSSSNDPSLHEACANAFTYKDPVCQSNSTLYWGTGNGTDLSCAHCICEEGWAGADCGRCLDVSVCPDKVDSDGKTTKATNCSSDTLLLTEEEATSREGKVFSCSCGGGEDAWTDFLCLQQPDTWIQFGVIGRGTDDDPAVIKVKEYAGIHARTEETWEGQYIYHYPMIFDGFAGPCKVYRDKCLPVEGTDVGQRSCVIYECETTEGSCPPDEYPTCEGFPKCKSPEGKRYTVHPCTAVPQAHKDITIACQEEKVNGSYVCYYQQTDGFAPLSMTCEVGSCLYEGGAPVQPSSSKTTHNAWTIAAQMVIVASSGGILLLAFLVFAGASDPGTASCPKNSMAMKVLARESELKDRGRLSGVSRRWTGGEIYTDIDDRSVEDLRSPLLGDAERRSEGVDVGWRGCMDSSGEPAVRRDVFCETVVNEGSNPRDEAGITENFAALESMRPSRERHQYRRPAILRWKELVYNVHGQRGNEDMEMTVLNSVSGYAGPEALYGSPSLDSRRTSSEGSLDNVSGPIGSDENLRNLEQSSSGFREVQETDVNSTSSVGVVNHRTDSHDSHPTPSTMTGILGPSGAGKSSLLDVLAGRKRVGEGQITGKVSLMIGKPSRAFGEGASAHAAGGPEVLQRIAGYVSQEDVLPGMLTCYEHLMFHARLRMERGASFEFRRERVLWVIRELGLTRVADSRIGDELERGLSGGERRRLSIAAELVALPALLFLDEPTTGLDAAAAMRVMTLLRRIATRGTTVLCSLHQPRPRVVDLLDKVILLSQGQVAYFGAPSDAASYFASIGRPFPEEQPQPADAMLTLCCRDDDGDLPGMFRRSPLAQAVAVVAANVGVGGESERELVRSEELSPRPTNGAVEGGVGESSAECSIVGADDVALGTELVEVARRAELRGRRRTYGEVRGNFLFKSNTTCSVGESPAEGNMEEVSFWVKVEALSRRLVLRAMRHPLLLMLHFGGSIAMASCLATLFRGRLDFTLQGAQDRFGVLFFLLLYLSLLSLTSLPVWREDRRLFLTEMMGGAYGHFPYFTSVALADILLVRVVPPLAFAVLAYPLLGLNDERDNNWCLVWFTSILVLSNVTLALLAMGVGALGLPLDLSNLVGGLMVLVMAAFGRFLLNGSRIPQAWRWLSSVTPIGYAFEALLINEFSDADGTRPYRIEASHCAPGLGVIEPLGPEILTTFSFASDQPTMHMDVLILFVLALAAWVGSLLVFFFATRTKPLLIRAADLQGSTEKRLAAPGVVSERTSGLLPLDDMEHSQEVSVHVSTAEMVPSPTVENKDSTQQPVRDAHGDRSRGPAEETMLPEHQTGEAVDSGRRRKQLRFAVEDSPSGDGHSRALGTWSYRRRGPTGGQFRLHRQRSIPLLLSWEGLRYAVPASTFRRRFARRARGRDGGESMSAGRDGQKNCAVFCPSTDQAEGRNVLVVLDGVSGYAGPHSCPLDAVSSSSEGIEEVSALSSGKEESKDARGVGRDSGGPRWTGTVTAIMGPSGAGKTSLLNALAGRISNVNVDGEERPGLSGHVRLNGVKVNAAVVQRKSAYITQEDVLPETLTCYEHLMFHARLRLPRKSSLARRRKRVKEVLRDLGLEKLKHARIGGGLARGISGGEKRRLSIGTELLTRPALLFLDEPTTGLDSSTALRVMTLVSALATRGTTVLCSLHQPRPEVVRLLDRIVLMSRGRVAFFGAPGEIEDHFMSIGRPLAPLREEPGAREGLDVADAMLDAVGDAEALVDRGSRVAYHSEGATHGAEIEAGNGIGSDGADRALAMRHEILLGQVRAAEASGPPASALMESEASRYAARAPPPFWTQLDALVRRSALNVARDPYLAWLHVLLTLATGVVLGLLFRDLPRLNEETAGVQDRLGLAFLLLLYLSLLCLTSLAAWRKQMALFIHERASAAYGAAAHLIVASSVDALACRIVPPILLALIVRPMAGLRVGSLAGLAGALVIFNVSLAGVLSACGAGARSSQEALAMGCLVVLFSALLSGFLVSNDDLPAGWEVLAWISPLGRGFEAIVSNEFSPYGKIFQLTTKIGEIPARSPLLSGDDILRCFGFHGGLYGLDLAVLGAVGAFCLSLAFVLLKRSR